MGNKRYTAQCSQASERGTVWCRVIGCLPNADVYPITCMPQPGKASKRCASRQPVFLINTDCKILANGLDCVMPVSTHPHQTGFVKTRVSWNNVGLRIDRIPFCWGTGWIELPDLTQAGKRTCSMGVEHFGVARHEQWPFRFIDGSSGSGD